MRNKQKHTRYSLFSVPIFLASLILFLPEYAQAAKLSQNSVTYVGNILKQIARPSQAEEKVQLILVPDTKMIAYTKGNQLTLSYGILKKMTEPGHLKSLLAHMTAHIMLNHSPAQKKDIEIHRKYSPGEYIMGIAAIAANESKYYPPKYFHTDLKNPHGMISAHNPYSVKRDHVDYVQKANVLNAARENDTDRLAIRLLKGAGFCPLTYGRTLSYFYDNPNLLRGHRHVAPDSKQWQRVDHIKMLLEKEPECLEKEDKAFSRLYSDLNQP